MTDVVTERWYNIKVNHTINLHASFPKWVEIVLGVNGGLK